MASGRQHFYYGAATGAVLDTVRQLLRMQNDPTIPFDWAELGLATLAAGVIAGAPDLIEPAVSPNHRGFFHSATCGFLVLYAAHGPHTARWTEEQRFAVRLAAWAYISHLAADSLTPKSINAI